MAAAAAAAPPASLAAVPSPVRALFKLFPLRVYAAEPLPARAPCRPCSRPRLYVLAAPDDVDARRRPSHNPSCLKWQTYLRIAAVDVDVVPSTNHASPSGALPFLLPAHDDPNPDVPFTGSAIARYARAHSPLSLQDVTDPRLDAYLALLAQDIRPAWLHALYLVPANAPLLSSLYLTSSALLRRPLLRTLRAAAAAQVLAATRRPFIDPDQLLADADAAFRSLSTLLADDDWFFGASAPGLFDADVFAYTYLILDPAMSWTDDRLSRCLAKFGNLVSHRTALYDMCWGIDADAVLLGC